MTPPGESREALLRLRSEITESATRAGFRSALWREPESPIAADSLETLIRCIDERRTVRYLSPRRTGATRAVGGVVVVPISISTGASPVLKAVSNGSVPSYRLDRIGTVHAGDTIPRRDLTEARALVKDEERATVAASRRGVRLATRRRIRHLHLARPGKWAEKCQVPSQRKKAIR